MKVKMLPSEVKTATDGISQVVKAYLKYLPSLDIEFVRQDADSYDLLVAHAGYGESGCDVSHCHGLYWTADHAGVRWEYFVNQTVINSLRQARVVTVPSTWVGESIRRDMHIWPIVIPHGVEWEDWQDDSAENLGFVLWNKNRAGDVCDPAPVTRLAQLFPAVQFISTFAEGNYANLKKTGLIQHSEMQKLVKNAGVYLATTKETFGIGILEAMSAGVPILGFAHGAIVELVQHGVNGYLAKPNDYDDLSEGLNYCLKYAAQLGANGREMARAWTWENACRKVADAYRIALNSKQEPAVSVIIPVYNKEPRLVARAIESARNQTFKPKEIIVVDDGSDAELSTAYETLVSDYPIEEKIHYMRQSNKGVAHARNFGIEAATTPLVCCLDSDDAIAEDFLRYCVDALVDDPTLGLAYTKITWFDKNGKTGLSEWPNDYDYDAFLRRQNQVPTCCVFRKELWKRIGGYRQRYAPTGAGAEDAEFWLRLGAIGYGGKQVTKKGLFIYSVGGGFVSGNKDYREVDWLTWHPWAEDKQHPFASRATPEMFSHPVRQYDEPIVSVIIPVGPGHESEVLNALDSLEAQSFRRWEAIVVWDGIDENNVEKSKIERAFPFIRSFNNFDSARGAGWARNHGAKQARAPFLVFLDADDWLYPKALAKMLQAWNQTQSIIYTDYVGRAIVKPEDEKHLSQRSRERIYHRNPKTNEVVIGHVAFEYDCELAQRMPAPMEDGNPYVWANVTVLIPKAWHDEIGGFDEQMNSWEDVDYHWRLAFAGKCYHRLVDELLVYNFHKGHRREGGLLFFRDLIQYLWNKYEGVEKMPCSGCGGRKAVTTTNSPLSSSRVMVASNRPPSAEFQLAVYNSANRGDHQVVGQAIFHQPLSDVSMIRVAEGWRINYQHKGGGERFYVHRRDIEADPSKFIPVDEEPVRIPNQQVVVEQARELQPPPSLSNQTPRELPEQAEPPAPLKSVDVLDHHIQSNSTHEFAQVLAPAQQQAIKQALAELDASVPSVAPVAPVAPVAAVGNPQIIHDDRTDNDIIVPDIGHKIEATSVDLQLLPGVGPVSAAQMERLGLTNEESISAVGVVGLTQISGISESRANAILQFIEQRQRQREQSANESSPNES